MHATVISEKQEPIPIPQSPQYKRLMQQLQQVQQQLGLYLSGVRAAKEIPDSYAPDLQRGVFVPPPDSPQSTDSE